MQEESSNNHKFKFIIFAIVLILAIGYMVYAAFPGNVLYFLTVSEFIGSDEYHDGRRIRVSGTLVDGSFQRIDNSTQSNFQLIDKFGGSADRLEASYVGVMPDLFFNPHSEIILEGRYEDSNIFHAEHILVKCPSKYQAMEEEKGTPS